MNQSKSESKLKLPARPYYSISEIVKRWRKLTDEDIDISFVLEYVRQGLLPVYIFDSGKYFKVQKKYLPIFDTRNIDTSSLVDIAELRFTDLNNPVIIEFETGLEKPINNKLKDVYVKHSDLFALENNKKPQDGLHTKIKNSYLRVILALVDKCNMDISERSPAVKELLNIAESLELQIRETKIRDILKEARELE